MSGNSHVSVRGSAMLLVTSHELCGPEGDSVGGKLVTFPAGLYKRTSEIIYVDCMDVINSHCYHCSLKSSLHKFRSSYFDSESLTPKPSAYLHSTKTRPGRWKLPNNYSNPFWWNCVQTYRMVSWNATCNYFQHHCDAFTFIVCQYFEII
jgi:hypothetical protein